MNFSLHIRFLLIFTLGLSFLNEGCQAEEELSNAIFENCCQEEFPNRTRLSYIVGSGLGYSMGYSSLDLFLSASLAGDKVPFLDFRNHIFNNGNYALNTAIGFRDLIECRNLLWGVNVAYDYYKNKRHSYNQVGTGFEIIGQRWDFHFNAYMPVGDKEKISTVLTMIFLMD